MDCLVGIDIGGTNVKIGIIRTGDQFAVLKKISMPTNSADPAEEFVQREAVDLALLRWIEDARLALAARVDPDQRSLPLGEQRAELLAVFVLDRCTAVRHEQHDA
jgi:predicted NBD/HSP70 family sugar kinase